MECAQLDEGWWTQHGGRASFLGALDEVALWDRPLTKEELVGLAKFEGSYCEAMARK